MKRVAFLLLLLLPNCSIAMRSIKVVQPTAIAFVDSRYMSKEEREVALDDFQFYMRQNRESALELGLDFILVSNESFRVGGREVNTKKEVPLGFVVVAPEKEPQVLEGVQTDADFACALQAYFGRRASKCPAS